MKTDKELFEEYKQKIISAAIDACEKHGYPESDEPLACLVDDVLNFYWNKIEKLVEALEYYEDKDGGPYATGDYHTADGGQKARQALKDFREWLKLCNKS